KEVYSTEKCVADVLVKIKNVNSKSQLSVSENKKLLSQNEFSYNAETMLLSFKRDVSDESMFFIKATNSAGSASDVVTIKCVIKPKPQVTITQPSSKFFSTGNCEANIKATILNIDSKSQITVKENGKSIPASLFTFNNKVLSLKKKVATTSKFEITATNSSGLASDVVNIKCVIPVKKPVVKITKPQKNPYVTEQNIQNFTAQVWNIKKVSQITVLASGKKVTTLDFNSKTGILNFKLSLQSDKTTVVVTVSNSAGSSSDQLTVIYNSPFRKPVINILRPTENPYKPANCLADVLAEILYVDDISKIILTENGKSIESFYLTFDKKENTIRIYKDVYPSSKFVFKATNKHGTTTKEVTINCK
ncbi:MAG: hypothetical protein U9R42_01430, partial [Bacteroidota bacterium]|nr:hypothetical protein [Bacteroidota bacterium]